MIRLVLVDDHVLLLDGLRGMFEAQKDIEVVGTAGDSTSALAIVGETRPNVLLLDVSIVGAPVTETVAAVRRISPQTRIVVLSMQDDARLVTELIALGISGYLLKSASWEELLTAVRMPRGHDDRLMLSISRRSLMEYAELAAAPKSGALSKRETEILMLTAVGLSNIQIGNKLGLTEATVKRHLHNVFGKLGASSRLDAVNRAKELRLIPSGPSVPRH
ncbi:response regulator transcription factor [Streptomyces sp. MST-110588]|uniref:response regulator transcription factor n=1 Tax=Streptomyces sp. MST-110588 TaxID=2833628 RepID=UPI001F5D5A69|nr:response regulator transcription factor [Streptomyces sp. MST-110588]UNO40790.1 response regulator transcription factor [Streptomyces sp. MST-110588]